jgi:CRISPR/Cas system endoribonuclease Cas6 (RAMP superfamily)
MSHALAGYRLPIGLFRFRIAPLQPLLVPIVNKGNMLRGGFGHAFRRLCCIPQCRDALSCPLAVSCPYKAVFEPSPPPSAESLSKNQDIPRPFVFRAPQTPQTRFEKGEPFEFDVVLIGHAVDFLPYFVLSFRELAAEGLGLNRAKCNLERVEQINLGSNEASPRGCGTVIYSAEDQLFRTTETTGADEWIKSRFKGPGSSQRITIRFMTPTFLRADGEIIRRPEFHHVFKRLRDRINALSTFFGDGPLHVDFSELGKRAEQVRTISCEVQWIDRSRISSKTRRRHELAGFVGEVTYDGQLHEFFPWLALGELVHVGRHTAWGNGWYHSYHRRFSTYRTQRC